MKVVLVAAITADGFIGRDDSDLSTKWTSKEDAKFFRSLSKEMRNLVVGSKTFATFNRKIEGRKFYVFSRQGTVANLYENELEVVQESPVELVTRLKNEGLEKLMIAGGSSIYTQFMQAGVVDELYLTVEPVLFGEGVRLFNAKVETLITLVETLTLSEQTTVFHYKVVL